MPKVESKTSLKFQELLRFRIGTWLHKIAKFFFLSIQINPLKTESDLNSHQSFRKKYRRFNRRKFNRLNGLPINSNYLQPTDLTFGFFGIWLVKLLVFFTKWNKVKNI